MIHEGVRAYNRTRASRRQPRMPHAQCTDELNHRTQAPPAQTGRDSNPFARITRVSAIAPNLVRVIRRLHPTEVTADERRSPTAGAVSQAPRKRRCLSVVKCLCACLGVRGAIFVPHASTTLPASSACRRWRAAASSQTNSSGRLAIRVPRFFPYRKFRRRLVTAPKRARCRLCRPDGQ